MDTLKKLLRICLPDFFVEWLGFWVYRKQLFDKGTWPLFIADRNLKRRAKNPKTYADKVLYKMAFDRNPILSIWADKVAVRDYVSETIGEEYLSRVFGIFQEPVKISREDLPTNFVIKPNHASGAVMVVWDGAPRQDPSYLESFMNVKWGRILINPLDLDWAITNEILERWLTQDYYYEPGFFPEWAYKDIEPSLIVEEFLTHGKVGVAQDYRFFIFNGLCEYIEVDKSWNNNPTRTMFDKNWNTLNASLKFPPEVPTPLKPKELKVMIDLAERLAQGIDHVRCDFYLVNSRIIFGELTNYHTAGVQKILLDGSSTAFGKSWQPETLY